MRKKVFILLALISTIVYAQEFTPNTSFFSLQKYYSRNIDGDFLEYQTCGFFESNITESTKKIFLLPSIRIQNERIKYYDRNGIDIDKLTSQNIERVKSISIPFSYSGELPNTEQAVGIGSVLMGKRISCFAPGLIRDQFGNPMIFPPAMSNPALVNTISMYYQKYESESQNNIKAALDKYNSYTTQMSAMDGFRIELTVDQKIIASQEYSGTSVFGGDELPKLSVVDPSIEIVNKIIRKNYNIYVLYKIKDSKLRSIDARIDMLRTISAYTKETQSVITRDKTMGVKVFGIGYRKSSFSQSINNQIENQYSDKKYASTNIIMDDASNDMIDEYEDIFFPYISREETIEKHLLAADTAEKEGNASVAKIHRDYCDALRKGDESKEIDTVAAAAALSSGNYIAFIASGVRAGINQSTGNYDYCRVINQNFSGEETKKLISVRHFSVNRQCTYFLPQENQIKQPAFLGIADFTQNSYKDPFGKEIKNVFILGIYNGSPMAIAGFLPGMIISSVNSSRIKTIQDLQRISKNIDPGDTVSIGYIDESGFERIIDVIAKSGPMRN